MKSLLSRTKAGSRGAKDTTKEFAVHIQMEKLLTIQEVAEVLGVSKSTVKVWASRRIIPVTKMGRLVRISPEALKEWMERNTEYDREEARNFGRNKARRARKSQRYDDILEELKQKD